MTPPTPERVVMTIHLPISVDTLCAVARAMEPEYPGVLFRNADDDEKIVEIFVPATG